MLKKKSIFFRSLCFFLAFLLIQTSLEQVQAQPTPFFPPGRYFLDLSVPFSLPVLRGMRVYPDKPFEFDFVVDSRDRRTLDQKETSVLIKYFLTCLTIPEQDLWVNLSPYESGRIVPDELALTDAGNNLLQQDKLLKQLASSLTYPESDLGKKFWEQVYKRASEKFGTTNLPINTYNKVWIVPDKAVVYDMGNSALIGDTHLRVMLDEDYLALKKHGAPVSRGTSNDLHQISAIITREIILPELEKEVNEGKNFAPVRQIFHSMILAAWFKRALKRNVLTNFYVNKKKIAGIDGVDRKAKEEIYKQYLRIYKVGAYNYIREDVDPISQQVVPRKYFSGGLFFGDIDRAMKTLQVPDFNALKPYLDRAQTPGSSYGVARVVLKPIGGGQNFLDQLLKQAGTSDSAQIAPFLKRLALTVAVAVPLLAMGGVAHAATYAWTSDGKVAVTFTAEDAAKGVSGDIEQMRIAWKNTDAQGYANSIYAGNMYRGDHGGALRRVLNSEDLNKYRKLKVGETLVINAPYSQAALNTLAQTQSSAPAAAAVRPAAPIVKHTPPAPLPLSAAPARPVKVVLAAPVRRAPVQIARPVVPAAPLARPVVKSSPEAAEGFVWNNGGPASDKPFFLTFQYYHVAQTASVSRIDTTVIDQRIAGIGQQIRIKQAELGTFTTAANAGAATGADVDARRQEVAQLQVQLAAARAEQAFDSRGGFHVLVQVPIRLEYLTRVENIRINGRPVSGFVSGWKNIPGNHTSVLMNLIVNGPEARNARITADILPPADDFRSLESIQGSGFTLAKIGSFYDPTLAGQMGAIGQAMGPLNNLLLNANPLPGVVSTPLTVTAQQQADLAGLRGEYGAVATQLQLLMFDSPIIFQHQSAINRGDPVVIQTAQGYRLPAVVAFVDPRPVSANFNYEDSQAVRLVFYDPHHVLAHDAVVKIIRPTDQEKHIVLSLLPSTVRQHHAAGAGGPPPRRRGDSAMLTTRRGVVVALFAGPFLAAMGWSNKALGQPQMPQLPQTYFAPEQPSLNLAGLSDQVLKNDLLDADAFIQTLINKAEEALPGAFQLNLFGGLWDSGGQLTFAGGVQGVKDGMSAGGFFGSGFNPTSIALGIVFQVAAHVTDELTGKIAKEKRIAVSATIKAKDHFQAVRLQDLLDAERLLIDLGAASERLEQLKRLKPELAAARDIMEKRVSLYGLSTTAELDALQPDIDAVDNQISDLQEKIQGLWPQLNNLMGKSKDQFQVPVYADLPWTGNFSRIADTKAAEWRSLLTAENSPDPRLQEVLIARTAMGQIAQLQGLEKLPQINIGDVYSNIVTNESLIDFPAELFQKSTTLQRGENPALAISFPLIDQKRNIETKVIALQAQEADKDIENMKRGLTEEFDTSIDRINSLSDEIGQAQAQYEVAGRRWQITVADTYHNVATASIQSRIDMDKVLARILELKAQYFKAETDLRRMRLLKQGETLVTGAVAADHAQMAQSVRKFVLAVVTAVTVSSGAFAQPNAELTQATSGNLAAQWANITSDYTTPLNASDPMIRQQAIEYALQNQGEGSIQSILAAIPSMSPDAAGQIFQVTVNQNSRDPRLFIQMIIAADQNPDKQVSALAYQALEDALTDDPNMSENLSKASFNPSDFYPGASSRTADKVFLTILARDPNSIAATLLLQSNYWSPEDLAGIYKQLEAYAQAHSNNPQIYKVHELSRFIYDWILRDEALENIDNVFSQGFFAVPQLPGDVENHVWIQRLADESRRLLNSSQWRQMKAFLKPELFATAQKATDNLINAVNPAPAVAGSPLDENNLEAQQIPDVYFDNLGDGQSAYITNANTAELARILQSPTDLRGLAMDRLMQSAQGRLLVLRAYLQSQDEDLLNLIQAQDWVAKIRADAQAIRDAKQENPTWDLIYRQSLRKMFQRTGRAEYLDSLLGLYTAFELPMAVDPRGSAPVQAQIREVAAQWALDVVRAKDRSWQNWYAGQGVVKPDVLVLEKTVAQQLQNEIDPVRFQAFLQGQTSAAPTGSRGTLGDMISITNAFADRLGRNDQSIDIFPMAIWIGSGVLAFLGWLLLNKYLNITKRMKLRRDHKNGVTGVINKVIDALIIDKTTDELWPGTPRMQSKNGNGNGNGNGNHSKDKAMIAPHQREIYGPVFESLLSWWGIVDNQWSEQDNYPIDRVAIDLKKILNYSYKTIRLMPWSVGLVWDDKSQPNNALFRASYDYFLSIASVTLDMLKERLQNVDLTESQRHELLLDKDALVANMEYVHSFLVVLHYRSTIEEMMSYKFSRKDKRETIYLWVRRYLLYQRLLVISNEQLRRLLPGLLEKGNVLIPGLYENPSDIVQQSESRLNYVLGAGEKAYDPMSPPESRGFKNRRFQSRGLTVIGGPALLTWSVGIAFLGLSPLNIQNFFISMFVFLVTLLIFWGPNLVSLRMENYQELEWSRKKLDGELDRLLVGGAVSKEPGQSAQQRVVAFAKREGELEVTKELSAPQPRVDAIVIISEDDAVKGALEAHIRAIRGKLVRNDVPVEVIHPRSSGSGNAYFEALSMAKANFDSGRYFSQYPHLKAWKDARVLFIFHGNEAVRNNNLIDWSITNGYRAAASMLKASSLSERGGSASGNIIIFSRDVYFGPIDQVPGADITLLTSRVNKRDLKSLGWVITTFSENGDSQALEINEKMDIDKIKEKNERQPLGSRAFYYLKARHYDLDKSTLQQYTAFNGIILMGSNAVAMNLKVAEGVQSSGLMGQLPLHLVSDVLIPTIKAKNAMKDRYDWDREISDYAVERSGWPDMQKLRLDDPTGMLKKLYSIINEEVRFDIRIHASVPHPWQEVYYPNLTKGKIQASGVDALIGGHAADSAQASAKAPGGIDLNFQPQFIQKAPTGFSSLQQGVIPGMPDGFRGFNFNIVRFTSQLTVNGAFQLMFNSN